MSEYSTLDGEQTGRIDLACCRADVVQVVHGLKQKILKLEGQLREKEVAHRSIL